MYLLHLFVPPPTIHAISLYLLAGFQWNLAQIFIMWVGFAEKVFKISGHRTDRRTDIVVANAGPCCAAKHLLRYFMKILHDFVVRFFVTRCIYSWCQFCPCTERTEGECDVTGKQIVSSSAANHRRRRVQRDSVTWRGENGGTEARNGAPWRGSAAAGGRGQLQVSADA